MDALAQRVLKALLLQGASQESLLAFLPIQIRNQLHNIPEVDLKDQGALFHAEEELLSIHYSWLFTYFDNFSLIEKNLYSSVLSDEQRKGLESMLKTSLSPSKLAPATSLYFAKKLYHLVTGQNSFPKALLKKTPLSVLLSLKKQQLVLLIDLLGLHDLAFEVKQIVDKRLLDKIMLTLTQEQKSFLSYCQKQPQQRWRPPKLNLTHWNGDAKTLNILLHQRGLFRFAHAFNADDHDLLYIIERRLDSGRGKSLEKYYNVKVEESAVNTFYNQVLQLAERFNRHENR